MIVIHSYLPSVHGPSVHDGLLSSVYDGGGCTLWLIAQHLHHLVHCPLLACLLLASQANQLELVLHLLAPSLRADGLASLKSSFQRLNDSLDSALYCRAHCTSGTAAAAASAPIIIFGSSRTR